MTSHETVRYAAVETSLGPALVAVSMAGVAAIEFASDRTGLFRRLRADFPDAVLVEDPAGLARERAAVAKLVDAPGTAHELVLDLRGSAQHVEVWRALQRIPGGETTTYGAIARELPVAATAQEVGAACAANRIAVAVPCHRVVKADGSISGYRWGVARKKRLLASEAVA